MLSSLAMLGLDLVSAKQLGNGIALLLLKGYQDWQDWRTDCGCYITRL